MGEKKGKNGRKIVKNGGKTGKMGQKWKINQMTQKSPKSWEKNENPAPNGQKSWRKHQKFHLKAIKNRKKGKISQNFHENKNGGKTN